MPLQFTNAEQESRVSGVKSLVYGKSGIGKTVLTATLPSPILISAESGVLSLSKPNLERVYGVNTPGVTYNMPMIVVHNIDDLNQAYEWCLRSNEAQQFQSISIDSISEIAEVVLNAAKRTVKDPRQAYGELVEKMETLIRSFRDLHGKHVCMVAKMEPTKDELTGVVKYGPSMPGAKLNSKVPYFFDEVFLLSINKDAQGNAFRFLQTQPDLQFDAKDRSGCLDKIEYPFMGSIISKILAA